MDFKILFFMGKGGVGKTTCAAAFALRAALKRRTLIVSLDPAHNLGDVLGVGLGDEPRKVAENLYAIEVDFEKMINDHLKALADEIKDIYGYLKVLNLDRYVDVLRYSPGIEEYATLDKIMEILRDNVKTKSYDIIVFDTPPTGLTLRTLALPSISAIWIEKLMELREAILDRRRIIEDITGEKAKVVIRGRELEVASEKERDPIYKELLKMKKDIDFVNSIIKNPKTSIAVLVVNPEALPILEAKRALDFLAKIGINVQYIVVNKVLEARAEESLPRELRVRLSQERKALRLVDEYFDKQVKIRVPMLYEEPKGLEKLKAFSEHLAKLVDSLVA
ncbi:MAG: ArsA family ATPase [Pyrodictiaceae archaeon]